MFTFMFGRNLVEKFGWYYLRAISHYVLTLVQDSRRYILIRLALIRFNTKILIETYQDVLVLKTVYRKNELSKLRQKSHL